MLLLLHKVKSQISDIVECRDPPFSVFLVDIQSGSIELVKRKLIAAVSTHFLQELFG